MLDWFVHAALLVVIVAQSVRCERARTRAKDLAEMNVRLRLSTEGLSQMATRLHVENQALIGTLHRSTVGAHVRARH